MNARIRYRITEIREILRNETEYFGNGEISKEGAKSYTHTRSALSVILHDNLIESLNRYTFTILRKSTIAPRIDVPTT